MSQSEVAEQVGVCQSTYFAWKNGRSSPNAKYYVKLATAFGVDL
ncbi:XRE family transcriptional regulator [Fibrisoma montanum]|uniref:XRE family transcriptional regulator n=1 Tax=Fibrisoma montanum TaxID=2305895 RepID=A0A418MKB2_9BACT|nr:XRE family transcriptional regulator [Fibrisoma montanum]